MCGIVSVFADLHTSVIGPKRERERERERE